MTPLSFNPSLVTSTIREVIDQVLCSGFLSLEQESLIHTLLFQNRYSEADLEKLDQLILALLNHEIGVEPAPR